VTSPVVWFCRHVNPWRGVGSLGATATDVEGVIVNNKGVGLAGFAKADLRIITFGETVDAYLLPTSSSPLQG